MHIVAINGKKHTLKTSVSSTYEIPIRYSRPNNNAALFSGVDSRMRMWDCKDKDAQKN